MKAALITPEYYEISHFGKKRKEMPPFGVMYLAAVLENKNVKVDIIPVSKENFSFDLSMYDIIGFSISSSVTYPIIKKVRYNSKFNDKSLLFAGGIHCTIFPEEVINDLNVRLVCIGEGEITISEIVDAFANDDYSNINGLLYNDNGNLKRTEPRSLIKNLDSIPFPARHLLPTEDVIVNDRLSDTNLKIAHILCSRGCPYDCNFCANQEHGIRYRSGSNIRLELEMLIKKYGIQGFCITDDNFLVNKKNILDICNEIAPLKLKWSSLSRVNTVDKEMLIKLKESGCIEIKYGIESCSSKMLEKMNKKITINDIKNAINITNEVGIKVKAFILHGFPGENLETTKETIKVLNELKTKIDRISLFKFIPLPGSPAYNNAESFGITRPDNFEDIYIYNNPNVWWGNKQEQAELEEAYNLLENFIKSNWKTC